MRVQSKRTTLIKLSKLFRYNSENSAFASHLLVILKIITQRTLEKYYLADVSFSRVHAIRFDIGATLENIVFNELLSRGYEVKIGILKNAEIDFIAQKGDEKLYFQVCYLLAFDETVRCEFGAYEDVRDNYPKYVLSMDKFDFSRNGIIHKNIID